MIDVDWKIDGENGTIFAFNNRQNAPQFGIDPHILAKVIKLKYMKIVMYYAAFWMQNLVH